MNICEECKEKMAVQDCDNCVCNDCKKKSSCDNSVYGSFCSGKDEDNSSI